MFGLCISGIDTFLYLEQRKDGNYKEIIMIDIIAKLPKNIKNGHLGYDIPLNFWVRDKLRIWEMRRG